MTSAYDSDPIFETNPRQLTNIIQRINSGEIALPDFQRDFVWEPQAVVELLQSVVSRYPVGTLLFWRQPQAGAVFQPRPFEEAPPTETPDELVLDGQQRLTSLYLALTGRGDERYYMQLDSFMDVDATRLLDVTEVDFEEAIFVRPKAYSGDSDADLRASRFAIASTNDFHGWLDDYIEARYADSVPRGKEVKKLMRQLHDKFLVPLKTYGFPVVTLPETTSLDAVCTIFETLNRTGRRLGVFELLTARFFPSGVNLRQLWVEAVDSYPVLEEFSIDPYALLQAVSLQARNSAQRADVLKLSAKNIADYWSLTVKGLVNAITLLQDDCGVASSRWLPYSMLLVPMAASWPVVEELKPLERIGARGRLQRYFWCTVFSGNFDQGANSQAGADYGRLRGWLTDPEARQPEAVEEFALNSTALRFSGIRRKALYLGVLCLCISARAQDFHTGQPMSPARVKQIQIESHHVFPRAYLRNREGVTSSSEAILNRALIDKETNRIIRDRAPSEYVAEMEETTDTEKLRSVLGSHLIRFEPGCPLLTNDYERFLDERLKEVVDLVNLVTGRQVTEDYEPQSISNAE